MVEEGEKHRFQSIKLSFLHHPKERDRKKVKGVSPTLVNNITRKSSVVGPNNPVTILVHTIFEQLTTGTVISNSILLIMKENQNTGI